MKNLTIFIAAFSIIAFSQGYSQQLDIPAQEPTLVQSSADMLNEFHKKPYLIYEGSNTQMRVIWQLAATESCSISWGTDSTCSMGTASTNEYGEDHQHGYTITGLTPGTKYHYKVEYGDAVAEASFRTAPPEDQTDLKFFVYGDTRSDVSTHNLNSQAMMDDYAADPDFQTISLFTGDHVTYGADEDSWQASFFNPLYPNISRRMSELAFISCLGNHELYLSGYSGLDHETVLYGKYFPFPFVERRYWSFDYGPIHVTVLDQYPDYYVMLPPNGYLDEEQVAWIEEDLSSTDKPWKVIVMHEPGWSCEGSSSGYSHPNNEDVQDLLQPLCEQYGVQIVFSAHNHYYARACKNGVYHITTAGGGAPLYEIEPSFPNVMHTRKIHHYCRVVIESDTMTVTAVTPYGEEIDHFRVDRLNRPEHLLGFLTKEEGPGLITDVLVTADDQSTSPDEMGYYGMELLPGYKNAHMLLEGYVPVTREVLIEEGMEAQLDTTLVPGTACLPEGIAFYSQADVDNYPVNNPTCIDVEGSMTIQGSDITNLDGLHILTSIGGDLTIDACPGLNNLEGLEQLTVIGGNLSIINCDALAGIKSLVNLGDIGGDLLIHDNPLLGSLSGLEHIAAISIADLGIYDNASLANCDAQSICEYLSAPGGTVEIHDNATGCDNQAQVTAACGVTGIQTLHSTDGVSLYPNPVSSGFYVQVQAEINARVSLQLMDTFGRMWRSVKHTHGEDALFIDCCDLPPGIYFCRIGIGEEMILRKVVISGAD